jgi:DNA polymerase III alpha subunit
MPFAELSVTSHFTFLTGASHPEEMMRRAADLGLPALAIADENSVAGIVRAHVEAREIARRDGAAPRLIATARIVTRDGLTEGGTGRAAGAPFSRPGLAAACPAPRTRVVEHKSGA